MTVLAIDQGTTGSTILVLDGEGRVVGRAYAEIAQHYPRPGWVEHDPVEIRDLTLGLIPEALEDAGVQGSSVAAIGITNQRETTLLWDRETSEPAHRAVVWQCRRTAGICERHTEAGHLDKVREKTGLLLDPYFSGTKVEWMLEEVEGLRDRASRLAFGTVDTWILWALTGGEVHATDPSNASRTLLYNIREGRWDEELLDMFGVPAGLLPEVKPSQGEFGRTKEVPGLPDGIPVAGIAGDQQAALFGQGCFETGTAKNTYGTGCFLLLNTGREFVASGHGLLTTLAASGDAEGRPDFALEGSVFTTGAAVQWLRDGLGIIESASETEAIARVVPDTGGVYVVPAFVGLGAPYWDADARGAVLGLTRGATRAHLVRAVLESIAYQTRDVTEAMVAESGQGLSVLRVDGGACRNDFLMQFQADILGVPVERPAMVETTAAGAALLAGLATGVWERPSDATALTAIDRVFEPSMEEGRREELYAGWKGAVGRVLTTRS